MNKQQKVAKRRRSSMKEDPRNIQAVCPDFMAQKQEETQSKLAKHIENMKNASQAYVKTCFYDGDKTEHMWIKVEEINEEKSTITGRLDNEPVLVQNVFYGDMIQTTFDKIEEVIAV